MALTDREKEQLKAMIDAGQPLPPRYKAVLFDQPHEAELIWPGKTQEVTNIVLPFQSIEQIDEPRAGTQAGTTDLFAFDQETGRQTGGWTNKLIWGDNKLVLASLKNGPLRREIEAVGGLKLVYIDPPFDVGADFSFEVEVGGDDSVTKEPSIIEELAYRDTWGRGLDSYLSMIFERLLLIKDLMAANASIYIHCDWRVNSGIRLILDEIFGNDNLIGAIAWQRTNARGTDGRWPRIHDNIFHYARSCGQLPEPEDDGGDCYDGEVVPRRLFISGRDAPELFELAEAALDEMTLRIVMRVERMLDGAGWVVGNDRRRILGCDRFAERVGIISCIGHDEVRGQVFDKRKGLRRVARLSGGEVKANGTAEAAHGEMDFGAQAAARTADGLILSPPFAPLAC